MSSRQGDTETRRQGERRPLRRADSGSRSPLLLVSLSPCLAALVVLLSARATTFGQEKVGKLAHLEFNGKTKQVRVECEMLGCNAPLEFFCCVKGTNDYEAMIRSEVKPSDLHFALLALGLTPGSNLRYSEATQKWLPPQGPPLQIMMQYEKNGKMISEPAWKWMRDVRTKKPAPPFTWVFCGSRTLPDGKYAGDITGYLVSIVNFDFTVIDVPQLASSSNELLEWERNSDLTPPAGTPVWMLIEPVGNQHVEEKSSPATQPANAKQSSAAPPPAGENAAGASTDAQIAAAQQAVKKLQEQWEQRLAPHRGALRDAAETHYKIIQELRAQQQRLIDAADHVQRTIDELEKSYQDLTTPRPETNPKNSD